MISTVSFPFICNSSLTNYVSLAGNTHRAWLNISLAKRLAECAGISVESHANIQSRNHDRHRRCFWSIYLLEQICDMRRTTLGFSDDIRKLHYFSTISDPHVAHSSHPPLFPMRSIDGDLIQADEIILYTMPLSDVWCKIKEYVAHRVDVTRKPPWAPDSEYSLCLSLLMRIESIMPLIHRFDGGRWNDRSPEELQRNRSYWYVDKFS